MPKHRSPNVARKKRRAAKRRALKFRKIAEFRAKDATWQRLNFGPTLD